MWPRLQTCAATNNNGTKQWKTANTSGQPVWVSTKTAYDYPSGETADDYPAFKWAEELEYEGYTDWRLPTKDELKELYDYGRAHISYTAYYYWSSTEYSANGAYVAYFVNGNVDGGYKTYDFYVRAVRSSQ